jgi:Xaa-Pro aminopeptidase
MSVNYFQKRRQELANKTCGEVVIIPSASTHYKNGSMPYHFRQDSTFYYLTGFNEPDSLLVLFQGESFIFLPELDPDKERWSLVRSILSGLLVFLSVFIYSASRT